MRRSEFHVTRLLFAVLACFSFYQHATAADPGRSIIPQLQERFGLSEAQVRGALGAFWSSSASGFRSPGSTKSRRAFPMPTTLCARHTSAES